MIIVVKKVGRTRKTWFERTVLLLAKISATKKVSSTRSTSSANSISRGKMIPALLYRRIKKTIDISISVKITSVSRCTKIQIRTFT